jgi:hypothetical protein
MLACIPSARDACEHDYSIFQQVQQVKVGKERLHFGCSNVGGEPLPRVPTVRWVTRTWMDERSGRNLTCLERGRVVSETTRLEI